MNPSQAAHTFRHRGESSEDAPYVPLADITEIELLILKRMRDVTIGDQLIRATEVGERRTAAGTIRLLTPTQCVMDRLAAYFHWNDLQSLDQAVMVASSQKISLAKLDAWAKREGASEKLRRFKQQLARGKRPK